MSRKSKPVVGAAIALLALPLLAVLPHAAIVIGFLGTVFSLLSMVGFNIPVSRFAAIFACICHAYAVFAASGSLLLATSVFVIAASLIPFESLVREIGYASSALHLAGLITGLVRAFIAYPAAGAFSTIPQAERAPPRPAPRNGQHSEEVLSSRLSLSSGEIARLIDAGIVGVG